MGLYTTHGAWDGGYGSFYQWRKIIAYAAGLPPLELMEGFYDSLSNPRSLPTLYTKEPEHHFKNLDERLPIKWSSLKNTPLFHLLNHSDSDGHITWRRCKGIADELEKLLPLIPVAEGPYGNYWVEKTQLFIDVSRLAYERKENLEFH